MASLPHQGLDPEVIRPGDSRVVEVHNLRVDFATDAGVIHAVDGVSFALQRGRTLALVGESGCGKSVTSYALLRLVQPPGRIVQGSVVFRPARGGEIEVMSLPENSPRLFALRGGLASMIFQEPMTALSPVHTVGNQIVEAIRLHRSVTRSEARRAGVEMLRKAGLPEPERRFDQYPHELSGGIRQRAVIAMALVCRPEVLIADEPTTALDVTMQARILRLMRALQREIGCAVLLITHDLGVVAQMADEVAVMYLGRIVESGPVVDVLKRPQHPYTRGLLESRPGGRRGERLRAIPGAVPSLAHVPPGCPFHPRCAFAQPGRCDVGAPPAAREVRRGSAVACVRAGELAT